MTQEFDVAENPKLSQSERLSRQRKNLKSRLGLGGPVDQLMDTAELIKDEDLISKASPAAPSGKDQQKDASALLSEMTGEWRSDCMLPGKACALTDSTLRNYTTQSCWP